MTIKRAVQISILLLVLTSGLLLGLSQRSIELTLIAAIGGMAGFIVTDWKQWFHLRGFFANIASVIVLVFAMKDFLGGDGASKLISVSNLLVYLQTVLMFQEKTPRLNWQLLVLSLLQIVVAAIFNLNFEGGLMFVFYFCVAGVTLILQSIYANNCAIQNQNQLASEEFNRWGNAHAVSLQQGYKGPAAMPMSHRPIAISDSTSNQLSGFFRVFQHLMLWMGVALIFATVLFYIIPRGEQAWFGPSFVRATATGMSKEVDLDERGIIEPSAKLVMRVWFEKRLDGDTYKEHKPSGDVYFRGMALGNLTIVDDKTTWTAPYDRVFSVVYQSMRKAAEWTKESVRQRITLQPTNDPLIYSAMPAFATSNTLSEIEFCFELSALSRRSGNDKIETTPYTYELKTFETPGGALLDSWPYLTDHPPFTDLPMHTDNPGQFRWLTEIDRNRYPTIVKTADQIAAQFPDRLEMLREMQNYFLQPGQFQYTLNYTNVDFNDDVDPIEDFFGNHKFGHCELYASALTLMLRSQGIPARLVVGFYASEFNEDAQCYMVRECHAHAWVEAYLRPEDCTQEMFNNNAAGRGGAWLRLDPTPVSELDNLRASSNAIENARTLWQDYVLGLDSSRQDQFAFESSSSRLLGLFDLSRWNQRFQDASTTLEEQPFLRAGIVVLILVLILIGLVSAFKPSKKRKSKRGETQKVGGLRRLLGDALSFISPELGKWMLGESTQEVSAEFYKRLTEILGKTGFVRQPAQTHREFARETISKLGQQDQDGLIQKTITEVTELFYQVRFGKRPLEESQRLEVMETLKKLEQQLDSPNATPASL